MARPHPAGLLLPFLIGAWCLGTGVFAQTPDGILMLRVAHFEQTSATQVNYLGVGFEIHVTFPTAVGMSAVVSVTTPSGAIATFARETDRTFKLESYYPRGVDFSPTFPDGTYTIATTDGSASSSITATVITSTAITPLLITNYDDLKAVPTATPRIVWQPIPDVSANDLLVLSVAQPDGAVVFVSAPIAPTATSYTPGSLPAGVSLGATLSHVRFSLATVNQGATTFAAGIGCNLGFSILCVTAPPRILTQPAATVVAAGGPLVLGISVTSEGPCTYQWYKDGVAIPGATGASYTVGATQPSDAGSYTVQVANAAGTAMSGAANVGVGDGGGLTYVVQPQSHRIAPGSTAVLSASVTGSVTRYAWLKDGIAITGATNSSYMLAGAQVRDSGEYRLVAGNARGSVVSNAAVISVSATRDPGRIVNFSIRSTAGTAARTLTVGLAVGGTDAVRGKTVLLRGVGPGLASFGVGTALADPVLTIYRGAQVIGMDDNWTSDLAGDFDAAGAFPLAPRSLDAATTTTLAAGLYSVQITGKGDVGVALAEIYDLAAGDAIGPRLVNLSARTQVDTGANILIAGFAIIGETSRTLLLRGAGPTLTAFGLGPAEILANPKIELYADGAVLASNDDWDGDTNLARAFATVGAFDFAAGTSKDAALLVTLKPGVYSVAVSGVNATTGIALVEVYDVP